LNLPRLRRDKQAARGDNAMFKRIGFLPAFMIVVFATILGLRTAAASTLALFTAAQSSQLAPQYSAETTDEQPAAPTPARLKR
jgi:hypothetical protein